MDTKSVLYELICSGVVRKIISYTIQREGLCHVVNLEGDFKAVHSKDMPSYELALHDAVLTVVDTLLEEKQQHIDRLAKLSGVFEVAGVKNRGNK